MQLELKLSCSEAAGYQQTLALVKLTSLVNLTGLEQQSLLSIRPNQAKGLAFSSATFNPLSKLPPSFHPFYQAEFEPLAIARLLSLSESLPLPV